MIRSGPATVLDTGIVTGFGGAPIAFSVVHSEVPFAVTLAFESDPSLEDVAVRPQTEGGALTITCVNFDSDVGRGSSQPVLLGEVGPDLIWLHFKVFRYGNTDDRTVHFTFYVTRKEDVNWTPAE